ncbi:MAG TPA: molybdopterin-dependent oxidoreductase [Hyphomicrobiaceae bacterium]|nr:molybdopterin-dependent oxidoreductase [Hyphomicrobiaceae bacterium]
MADGAAGCGTVRTTCPYCGVGCGLRATPDGAGGAVIAGDPEHPSNFGRICSKGAALGETLGREGRLLYPMLGTRRVGWDEALDHVSAALRRIQQRHGPGTIAFYLSGQLLTEDYYVANKLAKGFFGTPHVDTNSRLCMAAAVAGHRRAFGADVVPQSYDDLELADLVVLAGSNAAWCHPVLYQRIQTVRCERGVRVVTIDPRRTASSEGADLHLAIRPGTDAQLWNGLLVWLADQHAIDWSYTSRHTDGLAEALKQACAQGASVPEVARHTGLAEAQIETFYRWWTGTERVMSCFSQGINQSAQGSDKVNAIINCHLATARIGKPGSGPLSFTGQPNAMGGREVGGLANMLAAHMGYASHERDIVGRFWAAPNLATGEGLKAVEMFEAIAGGAIKALWVMGTNPAVSLPNADRVRAALSRLELLVVSDNVAATDTLAGAHVRLPAAAWGEKDGTVTNSERRISRQRAFLPAAGEARPDWWILCQVAARFGWAKAFPYRNAAAIFREHAALSGFHNRGTRAFDISAWSDLTDAAYEALAPTQWPLTTAADGKISGSQRLFGDASFAFPSGRARFVPILAGRLAEPTDTSFPFVLNTGRVRDQWHSMTRTGLSPRLALHVSEPFVELHPLDAIPLDLAQGQLARVTTRYGQAILRVMLSDRQLRGCLFVPIHWSAENSSAGRIGALVQPVVDPISGQPEAKGTPAAIAPLGAAQFGYVLSRDVVPTEHLAYWSRARMPAGYVTFFALAVTPPSWRDWCRRRLPEGEWVTYEDAGSRQFRIAVLRGGYLQAVLFAASHPTLPAIEWLKTRFEPPAIAAHERRALIAGRPVGGAADEGPVVCACFQVGRARILAAVADGAATACAIGTVTRAGTNCRSCVPELERLAAAGKPQRTTANQQHG